MGIGWPQLLVVAVIILVLFGRGRISEMMGDFGKGISSFKKGMSEDVDKPTDSAKRLEKSETQTSGEPVESKTTDKTAS